MVVFGRDSVGKRRWEMKGGFIAGYEGEGVHVGVMQRSWLEMVGSGCGGVETSRSARVVGRRRGGPCRAEERVLVGWCSSDVLGGKCLLLSLSPPALLTAPKVEF